MMRKQLSICLTILASLPLMGQVWLPTQNSSLNSNVGINQSNPYARLHISDDPNNCTPSILVNAQYGTQLPDPGDGAGFEPESEGCVTPYVFRVNTSVGGDPEIVANITATGTALFGNIYNLSSKWDTKLAVESSMGAYRSDNEFVQLGYPNASGARPGLNWYDAEESPFHISYGADFNENNRLVTIMPNGFTGIGTEQPETMLHIKSELAEPNSGPADQVQGLKIENNGHRDHDYALEITTEHGRVFSVSNSATVHIGDGLNYAIPYNPGGRFRLYVEDGIRTERVRVDVAEENGWADHVFDEDYEMMPLSELESYIKEHKHLPGVPSEKEAVEEGIDLAEMNKVLLEKVEEQTLMIIELNERLNNLETK